MKILSNPILDKKIKSYNFLVEMPMNEYYSLVQECIRNNDRPCATALSNTTA